MTTAILSVVSNTQLVLRQIGILSIVTGDLAFSYHGVDVATHVCDPQTRLSCH